jgi:hypothetical protein
MAKKWNLIEEVDDVKVYEDATGDIKCVYPKAPKWAADVAERIWSNAEYQGFPSAKGVKDIVRGQWAFWIANAKRKEIRG